MTTKNKVVRGLQGGSAMAPFLKNPKSMVGTGLLKKSIMTKKVANIFTGKAKPYPSGESLKTSFERISDDIRKISSARSHKKKVPITLPATEFNFVSKSTSKPATILYKKLPNDMILITGFEGFLTSEEICEKYGNVIWKTYFSSLYNIRRVPNNIVLEGISNIDSITMGSVYTKGKFSTIIAHVKKCGCLLHDIIQAVNGGEVKRIEI